MRLKEYQERKHKIAHAVIWYSVFILRELFVFWRHKYLHLLGFCSWLLFIL